MSSLSTAAPTRRSNRLAATLLLAACALGSAPAAHAGAALCPAVAPAQGSAVRAGEPLLPADNWWNLDIRSAPVDARSDAFIAFINNGGTRRLHPDFGGEESPGSVGIYGFPYAVVDAGQVKQPVGFDYADESDGIDHATGASLPFYPIPTQAITQPHWVEGGAPANVDQRAGNDRHLLMIDCSANHLYELYNVWYDAARGRWLAGSGAFFDLNTNQRRPEGWTSADAAGLAIFPGLVRYDEVYDPAVTEIGHALRVTVRATNGYVWPASHRAGSNSSALPMGARLRLKASVNGSDPVLRTDDPQMRKIFRAMQTWGLIVADNGSDMYVSGTFDTRWNNDILNPAFRLLSASDFEVIELGWNPVGAAPALATLAVSPTSVIGGTGGTGTVTLTATAPAGGAVVGLASANPIVGVPLSVAVAQGASSASFGYTTQAVSTNTSVVLTASYAGIARTATVTVQPAPAPAPSALLLQPERVRGGQPVLATITLSAPAPAAGLVLSPASSNSALAQVPASITVAAGASSAAFQVSTTPTRRTRNVSISATGGGKTARATLTVTR